MSKSDHKYVNQSEDYELNDLLQRNGFKQTKENRDLLRRLPPNTTHEEASEELEKLKLQRQ